MIDMAIARQWLIAAVAALLFGTGWLAQGWRKDVEIGRIESRHQAQRSAALSDALKRLATARKTNEKLVADLAAADSARTQLAEEKDREIRRLTTGRRCLDGAVVRVLNSAAADSVPPAGPEPVPADAAFATDTDVGLWARSCRDRYDACRARLGAINDFYEDELGDR